MFQRFVQILSKTGLNQQELADAIGVTQKTISIWEKGSVEPKVTFEQTKRLNVKWYDKAIKKLEYY